MLGVNAYSFSIRGRILFPAEIVNNRLSLSFKKGWNSYFFPILRKINRTSFTVEDTKYRRNTKESNNLTLQIG